MPGSSPRNPKYEEAYRLWVIEEWSIKKIAAQIKASVVTINKWKNANNWDADREKKREEVQKRALEAGIDRKASILTSLRGLRQVAEDAINKEVTDPVSGVVVPPLRPAKFAEASMAIVMAAKEEADIIGLKPLPPQAVTVIILERKRVAEELVRLATSMLLPAIPAKNRQAVAEAFMARLDVITEQLEMPPDIAAGLGAKQAQLVEAA